MVWRVLLAVLGAEPLNSRWGERHLLFIIADQRPRRQTTTRLAAHVFFGSKVFYRRHARTNGLEPTPSQGHRYPCAEVPCGGTSHFCSSLRSKTLQVPVQLHVRHLSNAPVGLSFVPTRILEPNGISPHVRIEVRAIHEPARIAARPPAQPCRVISHPVMAGSRFLVPLHPRISVPLQADLSATPPGLMRRRTIREVLFVRNHRARGIQLQ